MITRPIRLGPIDVSCRLYFPPHGLPYQSQAGPMDTYVAYWAERVRAGVGLVFHSMTLLPKREGQPSAYTRETLPNFAAAAQVIHDAGGKLFAQLHYNFVGNRWRYEAGSAAAPLFAPSARQLFDDFHVTQEMSLSTIRRVIDAHRISTANLAEAGYDGVELHTSHGMLLEAFLSPYFNHRTDEWGGSLENRMRMLIESLRAAREGSGGKLAVGIRLNCDEMLPGGLERSDAREILGRLVDLDLLDYVDLDIAVEPEQFPFGMPSYFVAGHLYEEFVKGVRTAAGRVPVLSAVGRITTIAEAERIIAEGTVDMVGAARGLIAEPDLLRNALAGREEDSRTCLACNICLTNGHGVFGCAINPSTGRERYWSETTLVPIATRKKVVVVGGGPAGMEAARVAAKKGHAVTLFEKKDALGGQMSLWASLPGRGVFATTPAWYARMLPKLGVTLRLGTEATAATVLAERPDAVIVATGGRYIATGESGFMEQAIPGHDRAFVFTPEQILEEGKRPTGRVLVLDEEGINTASGIAEILAAAGAQVRLVTRWLAPVQHMGAFEFAFVIPRLRALGVSLEQMRWLKEIGEGTVTTFDVFTNEEATDPVDAVVLCTARRSTTTLGTDLEGRVAQLFLAGDALSPRGLSEAFYEGQRFARYIGEPGAPNNFEEDFFSPPDHSRDQRPARVMVPERQVVGVA